MAAGSTSLVLGFFNSSENLRRPMTLATYVRLLYRTVLQREPAEAEVAAWLNGALVPVLNVLIPGFVQSPEFQQLLRVTPPSVIVGRLYRNVLGRAESAGENAVWADWLASGGTWEGAAIGFFDSPSTSAGHEASPTT